MSALRLLPSLAFVNLAGAVVIVLVVSSRPLFAYAQSTYVPKQVVTLRANMSGSDPRVSTDVAHITKSRSQNAVLVIALSDCAPCNQTKLESAYELCEQFDVKLQVLVCDDTQLSGADQLKQKYPGIAIRAASATDQSTLNIYFLPRAYGADEQAKLIYVQPLKIPFEEAVRSALIEIQHSND